MKVLIYHPVVLPVLHYGGTERVVMWLAEALTKMGHEVSVFAAPGSRMPPGIECITDRSVLIEKANYFDIFHAFTQPDADVYQAYEHRYLLTVEGNGQLGERFHRNTVFVSRNHARRHGATAYVYNGLDLNDYPLGPIQRPDRFLFLSKTSWSVKNLSGAIRIVAKFGKNLWVAGGKDPFWLRIWVQWKGKLGADWKWIGSVDQKSKSEFLQSGKAMVFPILWNEPFGIVIMESLASGTPVLAHPYGSVTELLSFAPQCLMKSKEDWKKAMRGEVKLPSAEECRAWVDKHFTKEKMAENYLKIYETVKSGKPLNAEVPQTRIAARDISGVVL